MKFSCTQENLKQGLLTVSRVASKNTNLPILQNVLLQAGDGKVVLAATNLEIGVQVTIRGKVDQPGSFTLPAQLLTSYVSLLSSERVDCALVGKEVQFSANGQATVMKGEEATDFPTLPTIEQTNRYQLSKANLEVALQQTIVAAAVDESRPEIAGVCFKLSKASLVLAATDSYRLAERTVEVVEGEGSQKVILPQRAAQELLRLLQSVTAEMVEVLVTENQFACHLADVEFVSRLVEGKFPEYEQIIPKSGLTTALLSKDDFIKAVKGAALFSKTGVNDITLTFSSTDQAVQIKAVNVQLGQNITTQAAQVTGDEVSITFNYRYLLDGLQNMAGNEVRFLANTGMSPGFFQSTTDEHFVYIIMPIKQWCGHDAGVVTRRYRETVTACGHRWNCPGQYGDGGFSAVHTKRISRGNNHGVWTNVCAWLRVGGAVNQPSIDADATGAWARYYTLHPAGVW